MENSGNRINIAIVHPQIVCGGGSEFCAVWLAEALKNDYNVSLVTMGEINMVDLNRTYGTNINPKELEVITLKIPFLFKNNFDALRHYRLARFCRKLSTKFDLMISAYNPIFFSKKGIQFIADFSFDDGLRRSLHKDSFGSAKWFYKKSFLRSAYLLLAKILSGRPGDAFQQNITVANSKWTAGIIKEKYGVDCEIIYPPASGCSSNDIFKNRENGFVCVSRISPEKNIEDVINIVKELRKNNSDVHLHILGRKDDAEYARHLKTICSGEDDWCFFEGHLQYDEKFKIISNHKFGISGCRNEAFGIASAEMVKSGCIVFVPDSGGQKEIVNNPQLIYGNRADAVDKINAIMKDGVRQEDILRHLRAEGLRFSANKFKEDVKILIRNFLSSNGKE
jgi:glycosyltransferase involved in cell wall biosynthesis